MSLKSRLFFLFFAAALIAFLFLFSKGLFYVAWFLAAAWLFLALRRFTSQFSREDHQIRRSKLPLLALKVCSIAAPLFLVAIGIAEKIILSRLSLSAVPPFAGLMPAFMTLVCIYGFFIDMPGAR